MNDYSEVFDKKFARQIAMMIEARLIWYQHYYPWADEIIVALDNPPYWILEIATVKYFPKAVEIINEFVNSDPIESFDTEYESGFVACLFLRYERGEISWATFLTDAGCFTDSYDGEEDCSYFYNLLNLIGDSGYSKTIEEAQKVAIEEEYAIAISRVREAYNPFQQYFRQYVSENKRDAN